MKNIMERLSSWNLKDIYLKSIESVERKIERLSKSSTSCYYTPHAYDHCYQVERIARALINKNKLKDFELSNLECYLLFLAIWSHDLGMIQEIASNLLQGKFNVEKLREDHDKTTAEYLIKEFEEYDKERSKDTRDTDQNVKDFFINPDNIFESNELKQYILAVNMISKYHRRKYDIAACAKYRYIGKERIRLQLLAAILRLADTLHIDTSRFDRKLYNILQIGDFDRAARLHWLKSCFISNVFLDIDKQTISINLDIPEYKEDVKTLPTESEWKDNYKKLSSMIHDDIFEDVLAVSDIFLENNMKPYIKVEVITNYVSGYSKSEYENLSGIISDLNIILSPNTSKVMDKSLESLKSLCNIDYIDYERFKRYTIQLMDHLKFIYKQRKCHVGLRKIIKQIEEFICRHSLVTSNLKANIDNEQVSNILILENINNLNADDIIILKNDILKEVERIKSDRDSKLEILYKKYNELPNVENIFLFGFSNLVSTMLSIFAENNPNVKNTVSLYVMECSSKRRFSKNNVMDFNDGIHYASEMSKLGFNKIFILPETSMPSLIEDRKIYGDKSLVLFGANGIDEKETDIGHTSGHLLVAIVAKHYEIPIYVIADTFKKGYMEWDLTATRREHWLTADRNILRDLESRNIKLLNYREDRLLNDFINKLITD